MDKSKIGSVEYIKAIILGLLRNYTGKKEINKTKLMNMVGGMYYKQYQDKRGLITVNTTAKKAFDILIKDNVIRFKHGQPLKLIDLCSDCKKEIEYGWNYCAWCGVKLGE